MNLDETVKVLAVDDRPENLIALEAILQDLEIELHTVASGEEALRCVLKESYALILMDVQMPGLDGFETATLIKGKKETRGIPIIFVTAINKEEKYIYEGYESGAVDYLFKPLDADIVRSKVIVFAELYRQKMEIQRAHEALESAQADLIQASKLESIGRLAASVAHEVKNPLQIQRMGLNYLMKKFPDITNETCKVMLEDMDHAITRATNVIQGLVDYSTFRSVDAEQVDLNGILEKVLSLSGSALQAGKVTVVRELSDDLPACQGDTQKLMQVIDNLILNAMQAMPDGGQLTFRSKVVDGPEKPGMVRMEVQDTGEGIPDDQLARVFDPFFSTRNNEKQVGLGLSICIGIVNLHGGHLSLENREAGACASLELPVCG